MTDTSLQKRPPEDRKVKTKVHQIVELLYIFNNFLNAMKFRKNFSVNILQVLLYFTCNMQAGQVISLGSTSTNVSELGIGEEESVRFISDGCCAFTFE